MERYLYRGVNPQMHKDSDGILIPTAIGVSFKRPAYYGEAYWGDGSTYGESESNSVIVHQRDSSQHPTSGVSTTPIIENARSYATHNGKYESGYIYTIDTELFEQFGVSHYIVSEHAVQPAIPGDKEVIIVAADFGPLPREIIVEINEI